MRRNAPRPRAGVLDELLRLVRSLGVGAVATVVDFVVLAGLVEVGGLAPTAANVPGLLAGGAVQFIGCRHLVFGATDGSVRRQLMGFALVELATLALNGIAYYLLVTLSPVPYALARPLGTFIVFVAFSYPLWRRVFRPGCRGGGKSRGTAPDREPLRDDAAHHLRAP